MVNVVISGSHELIITSGLTLTTTASVHANCCSQHFLNMDSSSVSGGSDDEEDNIPLLLPITNNDSDSDSESNTSQSEPENEDNSDDNSTASSDDGNFADIEDWDDLKVPRISTTAKLAHIVHKEYKAMYAS